MRGDGDQRGGRRSGGGAAVLYESGWSWKPFRRLAEAQASHAAADAIVAVALANTLFFAVPVGEARDKVAIYLALTMAPFAVLSPLVGPWLDRRRGAYRGGILLAAGSRAILAVVLSSRTDRLILYPLAFGLLVCSRIHGVSRSAVVPEVLPPGKRLMWANAWLAVVSVMAGALGAGLSAALNAFWGPRASLWAAAVLFLFMLIPAARLPARHPSEAAAVDGEYRALLSARLLAGGVAMAACRATVGYLTFLMAFLLRLGGEEGRGFAVVIAAASVGGLLGSVIAPVLRLVLRESLLLLLSLAGIVAVGLWAAGRFDLTTAAVVAAIVALATAAGRLAFDGLLQSDAPEAIRGRTFARYETVFQLAWVGGAGLATAVPFRPRGGMQMLAAIAAGGIALSLRSLLRRHRRPKDDGRRGH